MSLFKQLFSNDKKRTKITSSPFETDLHSHLIPGIDDGVQSLDESIDLIRTFKTIGYKRLITTPHTMKDLYHNNPEIILSGLEKVKARCREENIDIEIQAASEYYIDEYFMEIVGKGEILTFGDNYVLVEINTMNHSQITYDAIFELTLNGYKPVLAHPERYSFYHDDMKGYEKIKNMGALFQLNVISLANFYSPKVKKAAEKLIDHKMIDLIGSDAHDRRYLSFLQSSFGTAYYEKLLNLEIMNDKL
jgi:protein-tyrosine phosphatase